MATSVDFDGLGLLFDDDDDDNDDGLVLLSDGEYCKSR
jgi:hypothetical protein